MAMGSKVRSEAVFRDLKKRALWAEVKRQDIIPLSFNEENISGL